MTFWNMTLTPAELAIRGAVVFFAILILMRLSGKRQLGQMSVTEFVAVLLISNAVQNAMNGGDNSLSGGLLLATVLVALSWGIAWINFRSSRARHVFEGVPRLLVHRGRPIQENLRKELISESELKTILRRQGIHKYSDVMTAILESDGAVSVVHMNEEDQFGGDTSKEK